MNPLSEPDTCYWCGRKFHPTSAWVYKRSNYVKADRRNYYTNFCSYSCMRGFDLEKEAPQKPDYKKMLKEAELQVKAHRKLVEELEAKEQTEKVVVMRNRMKRRMYYWMDKERKARKGVERLHDSGKRHNRTRKRETTTASVS